MTKPVPDGLRQLFAGYKKGKSPLNNDVPEPYHPAEFEPVKELIRPQTPSGARRAAEQQVAFNAALFESLEDEEAEIIAGVPRGRADSLRKAFADQVEMKGALFAYYGNPRSLYLFIPGELVNDDNAGGIAQTATADVWPDRRKRVFRYRAGQNGDVLRSPRVALAAIRKELEQEGGRPIEEGEHIDFIDYPAGFFLK